MSDVMGHNVDQLGEARRQTYKKQKTTSVGSNVEEPNQ